MGIMSVSLLLLGILFIALGSTIWIGFSLVIGGFCGMTLFTDINVFGVINNIFYNSANSSILFALPLFILMGEMIFRSKMSEKLFSGLAPWLNFLPGRLLHVIV